MSEPQYGDQGTPAQDVPEADLLGDPEPVHTGIDEPATEDVHHEGFEGSEGSEGSEGGSESEAPQPDLSAAAPIRAEHTGNPVVDSVLDSLEELDRLPPAEHVAVFEAAHERLRGALSDAGEPPSES